MNGRKNGKDFEKDFKDSVDTKQIYYQRIKDNPSSFGQDSSVIRFTLHNDYDNFMFYKRCFFPFELKSTTTGSFSIQRQKEEKGKSIKLNQIQGLNKAANYEGIYAGFVFKHEDECLWMNIKNFDTFLQEQTKKSINMKDIKNYGAIEIKSELKKVHYRYDIICLLDKIIEMEDKKWEEKHSEK